MTAVIKDVERQLKLDPAGGTHAWHEAVRHATENVVTRYELPRRILRLSVFVGNLGRGFLDRALIVDTVNETRARFSDDCGMKGHVFYEGIFESIEEATASLSTNGAIGNAD